VLTTPELGQRYRNQISNDVVIQQAINDPGERFIAAYGFTGMSYRHPTLGKLVLVEDPLCPPGKIRGLRVGDWETLYAGDEAFEWMPGAQGMWYRMPSTTPGNGDTNTWAANGYMLMCDICLNPPAQWEIPNLTA
jgi:hypothetical protein